MAYFLVARVVQIMYTLSGRRSVTVHWMYRLEDTAVAEAVQAAGTARKVSNTGTPVRVIVPATMLRLLLFTAGVVGLGQQGVVQ